VSTSWRSSKDMISFFCGMPMSWIDWTARTLIRHKSCSHVCIFIPIHTLVGCKIHLHWSTSADPSEIESDLTVLLSWLRGPWLKPRSNQGSVALHNQTHELQPHKSLAHTQDGSTHSAITRLYKILSCKDVLVFWIPGIQAAQWS
jgi:hypothetical protein